MLVYDKKKSKKKFIPIKVVKTFLYCKQYQVNLSKISVSAN